MTAEGDRLRAVLVELRKRVEAVEKGGSTGQLSYSSVDVNAGRGYIPFMDKGETRLVMGRQPDGSTALVHLSSPVNPITPLAPICTPTLAGVEVACNGFDGTQYLDFSHVNVYCDNQLVGSIIKIPGTYIVSPLDYTSHNFQLSSVNLAGDESSRTATVSATPNRVVGTDVTDGIIDTLKLANAAITEAKVAAGAITNTKIGDNSIDSYKIAAYAIQAINIAAGAISTDQLAANAVTAAKIQALAITANELAANAITSGKIQAGSVTADKLAAQIILATVAFICGNPVAQRLVMDSTGISQYDANGRLTLQIGASPIGNSFSVLDSSGNFLAALDSSGVLTTTGISIQDPTRTNFKINGESFYSFIDNLPRGVLGRFSAAFNTTSSTAEAAVGQVKVKVVGNRLIRISSNVVYMNGSTPAELRVRYTSDGTRPTTSSQMISGSGRANVFGDPLHIYEELNLSGGANGTYYWFLLSIVSINGSSSVGMSYYNPAGLEFFVEDIGSADPVPETNSSPLAGTTNYTTTYPAIWTQEYTNSGQIASSDNVAQTSGGSAAHYGMMGFDSSTIVSDLSGATILKVELFLNITYTGSSTGTVVLGSHSQATKPATASTTHYLSYAYNIKNEARWQEIPASLTDSSGTAWNLYTDIKNGTLKGFTLNASTLAANPTYTVAASGVSGGVTKPALRITYAK